METPQDFALLADKAKNGDPNAQYALAAALSRSGRKAEAEHWLQSAAASGCADAIYTLATRRLNSLTSIDEAIILLQRAMAAGSAAARRKFGVLRAMGMGGPRDDRQAIDGAIDLARAGDAAACRELAGLLALGDANDPDIAGLVSIGSGSDPVAAAFCLARAKRGLSDDESVAASASMLERARYPRLAALRADAAPCGERPRAVDWASIAGRISLSPAFRQEAERLSESPDAILFRGAVAPELCEYAIAASMPYLGPSLVYDPKADRFLRDPLRTSATASLSPIDLDLALIALNRLVVDAVGLPEENAEFLSVLRYTPGQLYRPHLDCIPAGADFDKSGQRIRTALLYLSKDYEGGETHFLSSDLKFRGEVGDLLVFSNVDAAGEPDPASRHAGIAVTRGEKWLASKWFRNKKFLY